jgi:glycosyltransferase involved in cell wall biosynthesis
LGKTQLIPKNIRHVQKPRLGLIPQGGANWLGGQYYLQSLHENILAAFEKFRTWKLLQIGGEPDFFPGATFVGRGRQSSLAGILWRYQCDVVFPYTPVRQLRFGAAKAIGWIYDLQHVDMPEMFDQGEIDHRNKFFERTLKNSEITLTSSQVMAQRLGELWPKYISRIRVLQFTAKISWEEISQALHEENIPSEKFFLCPYQLWKHKNHEVLLEALKICRRKGRAIRILCSGDKSDFRNPKYPQTLLEKVRMSELSDGIVFLGRIPRKELLGLMVRSQAMILPSLYEGWSTALEEAKALGKDCLVSDIQVHREQAHSKAAYFRPDDASGLAGLLLHEWAPPNEHEMEESVGRYQQKRREVGEQFLTIIAAVLLRLPGVKLAPIKTIPENS